MAFDVKGKTVEDLKDISFEEFNHLTKRELSAVVSRMGKVGNQRIKSFLDAGELSPAVINVIKSGGRFGAKGKTLNQLRQEFVRIKNFLESKTGTLRQWKRFKKKSIEALRKANIDVTEEQFDEMWYAYSELRKKDPALAHKELKYKILGLIAESIKEINRSANDIISDMESRLDDIYEEWAKTHENTGVSEFFDIG